MIDFTINTFYIFELTCETLNHAPIAYNDTLLKLTQVFGNEKSQTVSKS